MVSPRRPRSGKPARAPDEIPFGQAFATPSIDFRSPFEVPSPTRAPHELPVRSQQFSCAVPKPRRGARKGLRRTDWSRSAPIPRKRSATSPSIVTICRRSTFRRPTRSRDALTRNVAERNKSSSRRARWRPQDFHPTTFSPTAVGEKRFPFGRSFRRRRSSSTANSSIGRRGRTSTSIKRAQG